ncbi:phosphoribosylpyrophosphate synthetase [Mucilaginibacter terrae]|uniref:phosphoribosylpyrophosphate synthetase n=1 Tax=Mucilaginibacter terrae TaxID=1955052 RepID=UPI003641910E
MKSTFHYATVTDAINILKQQGFTTDFNLAENHIKCDAAAYSAEEFEILDVYRYEGNSDPADEATVYAIVSTEGVKGILVTGYGDNSDSISAQLLAKLHY